MENSVILEVTFSGNSNWQTKVMKIDKDALLKKIMFEEGRKEFVEILTKRLEEEYKNISEVDWKVIELEELIVE